MDKLDSLIASARRDVEVKRRDIADAQAALQFLETRLCALNEAAEARPLVSVSSSQEDASHKDGPRRAGRQPGAISKVWKRVLVRVSESDPFMEGVDFVTIQAIAAENGIPAETSSIRDRVRRYADDLGLLERVGAKFMLKAGLVERYRQDLADGSVQSEEEAPDNPEQQEAPDDAI